MTRSWFKQALWGNPAGSPPERRVYIMTTVILWLAVVTLHEPVPGLAFEPRHWMRFLGCVLFLWAFFMFFEGATSSMLDGLLGVPGSVSAYSHGPETPLFAEGGYAQVRHPQYRAFIPVEEAQLLRARGDDYRKYMERTPWRLFRGFW